MPMHILPVHVVAGRGPKTSPTAANRHLQISRVLLDLPEHAAPLAS